MPRRRVTLTERETPAARALRRDVAEELDEPLAPLTEKTAAKVARRARNFVDRVMAGGGDRAALDAVMAEDRAKRKPLVMIDGYAAHHASALRTVAAAKATRPAPAASTSPATDDTFGPRKPRRRLRAGVTYVDPRLFDTDEWDD